MSKRAIWKYELEGASQQTITMPRGATLLTVALQGSTVCLWAMVNPDSPSAERHTIESYGTGHIINAPDGLRFIGTTVDMSGSPLVFHHFERILQ